MINYKPDGAQTQYAELLDLKLALMQADGHGLQLKRKVVKSNPYWYLVHTVGSKSREYSLGRETEELLARVEQQKTRWMEAKTDVDQIKRQVKVAKAAGCTGCEAPAFKVIKALEQAGYFKAGAVMVGSHAFSVYSNMLGVDWSSQSMRTHDIDIMTSNTMMLALPEGIRDIKSTLQDTGFSFFAVPALDHRKPSTSFKVQKRQLRVDLLTNQVGGKTEPVLIAGMEQYAYPLPFLDYLTEDAQKAVVVHAEAALINVPHPARFALHKLVVASRRPTTEAAKKTKDIKQASQLLEVLIEDHEGWLEEAIEAVGAYHSSRFQSALLRACSHLKAPIKGYLLERLSEVSVHDDNSNLTHPNL